MRNTSLSRALGLAWGTALLAACASTPAGPPPLDPVGNYTFTADAQGQSVGGEMSIAGSDGAYSGEISADVLPAVQISSVVIAGQNMTITAPTPQGELVIEAVMEGDSFTGTWAMAGMGGSFTGKKTN